MSNIKMAKEKVSTCQVCGQKFTTSKMLPSSSIRDSVAELIKAENPKWAEDGYICQKDLAYYRGLRVERLLSSERGELTNLENDVIKSLAEHEILTNNTAKSFDLGLTFGEKLADRVASFGGSWLFILSFGGLLLVWIIVNSIHLLQQPFDPYPYILLNLVLSCVAAMQAPIIMMSQNRQESKDRNRSEHEYQVNLKAELEIRHLHEKMDHLLSRQWEKMLEVQQLQLELLTDLNKKY